MVQRVVSSLGGIHAVHFVHIYVHLIPIDVGINCWSNTTTASEPHICLQCPSGKHRGIERQNDFTSQVHLVCIRSPGTNHAGGLGWFHLGTTMKVLCIFSPLVEKWWLCFLEAFLLAYSWNPKRVTSKEGSMQPSVSQPESGFGNEKELEGGRTA